MDWYVNGKWRNRKANHLSELFDRVLGSLDAFSHMEKLFIAVVVSTSSFFNFSGVSLLKLFVFLLYSNLQVSVVQILSYHD